MKLFAVLIWTTIEDFIDRNKTGYYSSGQSYTLVLEEMILDELPPGSK